MCLLGDNVEKYVTDKPATDGNLIILMNFAYWIATATDTHS